MPQSDAMPNVETVFVAQNNHIQISQLLFAHVALAANALMDEIVV